MAITKVCDAAGSPQRRSRRSQQDNVWLNYVDYTRTINVISDSPTESSAVVEAATGLVLGLGFAGPGGETDANARCVNITSTKDTAAPTNWVVTGEFTTNYQSDDPFSQVFSYSTVGRSQAFEETIEDPNPKPVQNSAGDAFETPPTIEIADLEINVQRLNDAGSINMATLLTYYNSVNEAAVTWDGVTWPGLSLRFRGLTATPKEVDGTLYLDTQYRFLAQDVTGLGGGVSPHDDQLLDYGYFYLDAGTKKPIIDEETHQRKAELLDGAGAILVPPADPVYIHFPKRERKDFTVFPFTAILLSVVGSLAEHMSPVVQSLFCL